jgi:hypothetical protein
MDLGFSKLHFGFRHGRQTIQNQISFIRDSQISLVNPTPFAVAPEECSK